MSMPPYMLFVENVVGFETSDTHKQMIEILVSTGFITQEYILTPLQFGVPYSRPRYFCLAKRKPSAFKNPHVNNQLLWTPSPFLENGGNALMTDHDESHERWKEWLQFCKPIESFLEFRTSYQPMNAECNISAFGCETLDERDEGIASSSSCPEEYVVPLSLIERWGSAMDIVYPDSKRCCCFTKSYFRYVKGTGSLLATVQPQRKDKVSSLKEQGLRYFTPREVANLHSLPESFQFPPHISLKQQYALLGNSLSIAVVASLLRYLFVEPS